MNRRSIKKTTALLLTAALLCLAVGCTAPAPDDSTLEGPIPESTADTESTAPVTLRLGGLKGPTTMGLVGLLSDAETADPTDGVQVDFRLAAAADELTPLFIQGKLDVLAAPVNLASVLYNKTEGSAQLAAVNTLGVLYVVEQGDSVQSVADLAGKTVYATGKGTTPEYMLTYLLAQNGLTVGKDVQVEWKSEATEIVALMTQTSDAVALLPQPFVTVASGQIQNLRVALDLTAEWQAINDAPPVTGGVIVRREFAEQYPDALAAFLERYAASTAFVNEQPAAAAQLIEGYGIVRAAVAEKAIPACNIVFLTGQPMTDAVSGYLQVLYEQDPAAVGGALPGEDFYLSAP